jgi:segregation and condensation protein A
MGWVVFSLARSGSYKVRTQAYSGPFDLLLQLVSRQKVDIGSISIAEVADQYIDEVDAMGELDLDVASDFLLVASTLLEIKAASLVPDHPVARARDDEEDEDDDLSGLSPDEAREVLVARLVAYKQFRNAAAALGSRLEAEGRMVPRTAGPDPEFLGLMPDYLKGITLRSLAVICADLDSRRQGFLLEAEHVAPKRLPIALTVASVDRVTRAHPLTTFSELLDGDERAETLVATFLAILELCKRGMVTLSQARVFGEIEVARVEGAPPFELDNSDLTSIEEDS